MLCPQAHDVLNEAVISVDLNQDIHTAIAQKGVKGQRLPEQILIDCYVSRSLPGPPDLRLIAFCV